MARTFAKLGRSVILGGKFAPFGFYMHRMLFLKSSMAYAKYHMVKRFREAIPEEENSIRAV